MSDLFFDSERDAYCHRDGGKTAVLAADVTALFGGDERELSHHLEKLSFARDTMALDEANTTRYYGLRRKIEEYIVEPGWIEGPGTLGKALADIAAVQGFMQSNGWDSFDRTPVKIGTAPTVRVIDPDTGVEHSVPVNEYVLRGSRDYRLRMAVFSEFSRIFWDVSEYR